jgi:hypothetical protein
VKHAAITSVVLPTWITFGLVAAGLLITVFTKPKGVKQLE